MDEEFIDTESKEYRRARKRARRLLVSSLDPQQKRQFKRKGWFEVTSNRGNVFRISDRFPFNVRLAGIAKASRIFFCMEAEDSGIPPEDVMLAEKLMLENDEARFLGIAALAYIPKITDL